MLVAVRCRSCRNSTAKIKGLLVHLWTAFSAVLAFEAPICTVTWSFICVSGPSCRKAKVWVSAGGERTCLIFCAWTCCQSHVWQHCLQPGDDGPNPPRSCSAVARHPALFLVMPKVQRSAWNRCWSTVWAVKRGLPLRDTRADQWI